jgi:hypothetical protein
VRGRRRWRLGLENHVTRIFNKLGLGQSTTAHRRVLAVLTYLRNSR